MHAVDGNTTSGVVVATMIRSMSLGASDADASAARDAKNARSDVCSPSATTWRCRMPVRVRIHSSLVSIFCESSSLVMMRDGRYRPVPAIRLCMRTQRTGRIAIRSGRARRRLGDPLGDAIEDAALDFGVRARKCRRERESVGAAMTFHHDAAQADERRAVVTARIDAAAK